MPRPDLRCRHKIRMTNDFYLFKKHKYIYYAYYPSLKITRSTGQTEVHKAYIEAYDILAKLSDRQSQSYYKPYENNKKRQRDLLHVLTFLDQNKPLTANIISNLQKKMLQQGLSGKSINNYIYVLKKAYTDKFPDFKPLEYNTQYRSCFPVKPFYGFWQKCSTRLHYLAFFAMTTGCRAGEIYNCEPFMEEDRTYLKINGTKTKNAKRIIPVLPETLACLEYLQAGFRTTAYKESVIEAGRLCGFDETYIEENNIVFHSFRKMYKTLLESMEIPSSFVEYYMGHSQTRNMSQLYFIGSSADDSDIYPRVIEALRKFL